MPWVPILNVDTAEIWRRLEEPVVQRRLVLVIVCVALLLDNMLYMVIVPIIPDYLRYIGAWDHHPQSAKWINTSQPNGTWRMIRTSTGITVYEGEDSAIGFLFASKAIIQLMINPFSGAVIDRIGYDLPMMFGLTVMFLSTAMFACGQSYGVLLFARSLQGVGSAFADTGGLAMIADRFTEEAERSKAIGVAQAFISFGSLVAPPFGGLLYQFAGKEVPFIILSLISLADGLCLLFVMRPFKQSIKAMSQTDRPSGTPIWKLFIDPFIAVAAGTLVMANISLAFLEPTISLWMEDTMDVQEWQMGLIWLPAFFPHVIGVYTTVKLVKTYPQYQWLIAAIGLALEGIGSFLVPFAGSFWFLIIPLSIICFGIAQVDTSLLPLLGFLVDVRYVSVYGSIYAIADISYSFAYALGPVIAGGIVQSIGFLALNMIIAVTNLGYVPMLWKLRNVYEYKPFENEGAIMMTDPPPKQYQTYMVQDGTAVPPRPPPPQTAIQTTSLSGETTTQEDHNPFRSNVTRKQVRVRDSERMVTSSEDEME